MILHDVEEYFPNRNAIRIGDIVKCRTPTGRPFMARVRRIRVDEYGDVREVEVFGAATRLRVPSTRTFPPSQIYRVAQSRQPDPK